MDNNDYAGHCEGPAQPSIVKNTAASLAFIEHATLGNHKNQ
jgi:hypothetical protein